VRVGSLALLALSAMLGCSSSFSLVPLDPPTTVAPIQEDCTIGVGSFTDKMGVDYGFDLQTYLKERGPCRRVERIVDRKDAVADYVIEGDLKLQIHREDPFPYVALGFLGGLGMVGMVYGGVFYGFIKGGAIDDTDGGELSQAAFISLIAGSAMVGTWIGLLVIDGAVGQVRGEGTVQADLILRREGQVTEEWKLTDEVDVYISNRDPYDRTSAPAFGPIYTESLQMVFADIAARIARVMEGG